MRKTMVIPTYWCRKKSEKWQQGDTFYDHPTPIDNDGTLGRTLESMKILDKKDFKLLILICTTTHEIENEAEQKVLSIIKAVNLNVETYIFTIDDLQKMLCIFKENNLSYEARNMLSLSGYSNIRNMCLLIAAALTSDVVILIDDDEIFEISDFIPRSIDILGKRVYGDVIHGVAGYYLNKNNLYYDDIIEESWMTYWNRFASKAKAFDKIIGKGPRIKKTPFVFGGAMIIHKELFECVPFDPLISRGEDIDYLINSKMYGFSFFLDNTLSIKHLPLPKSHPQWKNLREDIYRFVYERNKIVSQKETNNMVKVTSEDFDPYPGEFLKDDLEDKIFKSNIMLAMQYMIDEDKSGCQEALKNIHIGKYEAVPKFDPFSKYIKAQKNWSQIINIIKKNRYTLRCVLEDHNLSTNKIITDEKHIRMLTKQEINFAIRKITIFSALSDKECSILSNVSQVKTYFENEKIFSAGDYYNDLYVVLKGNIRLTKDSLENEIIIANSDKEELLGESCLVDDTYQSSGFATEFTELLIINKKDLKQLIKTHPDLGIKLLHLFLSSTTKKMNSTNKRIDSILRSDNAIKTIDIE